MRKLKRIFIILFFSLFVLSLLSNTVMSKESDITLEFFYSSAYCKDCEDVKPIVNDIEGFYNSTITIKRYPVDIGENIENFNRMMGYSLSYPSIVVLNNSADKLDKFNYSEITYENINQSISYHLIGNYSEEPPEKNEKEVYCFFGICIDVSELSLPVLTVTMAFLDSFNPCSFFILIFLLNLLIYVKSRKRMLLIGGIFIFFSAFIYFLLMTAILNVFLIVEQQIYITIFAGIFALGFGLLNIKDFFFSSKGPSISLSDEKKSDLFKKMRKIVNTSYIPSMIAGTVVLAIFANTYELLCSIGLPLVYTTELSSHNLDNITYYSYIFLYNIIYVIPLITILIVFVVKLGKKKLTEKQGRLLKLISGIMMFLLGLVLLISPYVLKNLFAAISIILISIISSFLISYIWRKFKE